MSTRPNPLSHPLWPEIATNRNVTERYTDPLDLIWLDGARRLGWKIRRSNDAYASWDGVDTLTLALEDELDADDSLAQMILHEICHALVAGPHGTSQLDWGLSNEDERDLLSEYATHRLQAGLAGPYGLRDFFAVTTQWRPYWDQLPADPLQDGEDPAIVVAQRAWQRAWQRPYRDVLPLLLSATEQLAALVRPWAPETSLWARTRQRHETGLLLARSSESRCGHCAWFSSEEGSSGTCLQALSLAKGSGRTRQEAPACERWEPPLKIEDCGRCGACCREGFDLVQLRKGDQFLTRHPALVSVGSVGEHLARPGGRCPLLEGDEQSAYRCADYELRPQSCAEFEVGGEACLQARRRVHLSF